MNWEQSQVQVSNSRPYLTLTHCMSDAKMFKPVSLTEAIIEQPNERDDKQRIFIQCKLRITVLEKHIAST